MQYPNLTQALNDYCSALQSSLKSDIQVRTGALRDSITVSCVIDSIHYQLVISLNNYWRYLLPAAPLNLAFNILGLQPSLPSADFDISRSRFKFDFSAWESRLNAAFESDLRAFLNIV